ncbi:MAG: hypothetical protein NWR54_01475, partial [Paracoccaceae bacterium]|nr:hypothetical protein [Paracoccaceae bacterium]
LERGPLEVRRAELRSNAPFRVGDLAQLHVERGIRLVLLELQSARDREGQEEQAVVVEAVLRRQDLSATELEDWVVPQSRVVAAGARDASGDYPAGSVNALVEARLASFAMARQQFGRDRVGKAGGEGSAPA